jgi:hypothetical protein
MEMLQTRCDTDRLIDISCVIDRRTTSQSFISCWMGEIDKL